MNDVRSLATAAAVAVALLLSPDEAVAKTKAAKSSQLAVEWWQWVLAIPSSSNPLLDTTGDSCMVGQHGATWFLAGSWVGPVTRDCDVPQGATLVFPVINEINFDTPFQCGQGGPLPSSDYRALSKAFIDGAANLSVVLDGTPIAKLKRTVSPVFEIALPEDNIFLAGCSGDLSDGIYSPAVDDGYYVQLSGLAVGTHTLVIHAENPTPPGFSLDVTYNLTVVPVITK